LPVGRSLTRGRTALQIQTDDVSHLLLLNRRTQGIEPTLFATELEKFRPYQSRISAAIASQSSTLQDIGAIVKRVDSGKTMRDLQRKWAIGAKSGAELERRLRMAHEAYDEIRGGLAWVEGGDISRDLSSSDDSQFPVRQQGDPFLRLDADPHRHPQARHPPLCHLSYQRTEQTGIGGRHQEQVVFVSADDALASASLVADTQPGAAVDRHEFRGIRTATSFTVVILTSTPAPAAPSTGSFLFPVSSATAAAGKAIFDLGIRFR
jgi:hypothetical protein